MAVFTIDSTKPTNVASSSIKGISDNNLLGATKTPSSSIYNNDVWDTGEPRTVNATGTHSAVDSKFKRDFNVVNGATVATDFGIEAPVHQTSSPSNEFESIAPEQIESEIPIGYSQYIDCMSCYDEFAPPDEPQTTTSFISIDASVLRDIEHQIWTGGPSIAIQMPQRIAFTVAHDNDTCRAEAVIGNVESGATISAPPAAVAAYMVTGDILNGSNLKRMDRRKFTVEGSPYNGTGQELRHFIEIKLSAESEIYYKNLEFNIHGDPVSRRYITFWQLSLTMHAFNNEIDTAGAANFVGTTGTGDIWPVKTGLGDDLHLKPDDLGGCISFAEFHIVFDHIDYNRERRFGAYLNITPENFMSIIT